VTAASFAGRLAALRLILLALTMAGLSPPAGASFTLDGLTQERLSVDGRTYVIGDGYTLNGDLAIWVTVHSIEFR
jgi:hypothetical protein